MSPRPPARLLLVRRAKTTSFDIYGIDVPDGCGDLELAVYERSCERRGHGGTRAGLDTSGVADHLGASGQDKPSDARGRMAMSTATRRPPRGDGRVALLEAAIRVGAHHGLRGLTIRSVAAEAGVSHGLVRHHFGSRQQLIDEALEHAARMSMSTGDLEPGTGDPADFSRALEDIVAENPDVQAFQYEMAMEARRRPELLATNHAVYEQYRQATQRELVRMGLADDPALAHAVFAMLDGLVFQKVLFGKPVEPAIEWLRTMMKALQAAEAAPAKRGPRARRVESADAIERGPAT